MHKVVRGLHSSERGLARKGGRMHKHGFAILQVAKAPLLPPRSARGAETKAQRQSSGGGVRWNAFFSWSARFSGAALALPKRGGVVVGWLKKVMSGTLEPFENDEASATEEHTTPPAGYVAGTSRV